MIGSMSHAGKRLLGTVGLAIGFASAALLTMSVIAGTTVSASAAGSTCGIRQNLYAGGISAYHGSVYGARAMIEYANPNLCGSDAWGIGQSSAWSMVTAYSVNDPNDVNPYTVGWAQAGYIQAAGYDRDHVARGIWRWAQWTSKCKSHGTCSPGEPLWHNAYYGSPSGYQMYSVFRSANDGHLHMQVDGIQIAETNYDPTNDWQPAWSGQFFGEAHEAQTDIPGVASDRVRMNYLQSYNSDGTIRFFQTITGKTSFNTRNHRYVYNSSVGGKGVLIWTDPL